MSEERHERDLIVWDVPPAIERGAAFRIKVGGKCSAACSAAKWPVTIRDHEGRQVASVALGDAAWPQTAGLFYSELELSAPPTAGLFAWQAELPLVAAATPEAPAHAARRVGFNVRSVPEAECRLRVIAVDRVSQNPVPGLKVVAHPYRGLTDADGLAEISLPRGRYRLFVSGNDYLPFRNDADIQDDTTIRAELELDTGPSDAELWS